MTKIPVVKTVKDLGIIITSKLPLNVKYLKFVKKKTFWFS